MADKTMKHGDLLAKLNDTLSPMIAEQIREAIESARKDAGTPEAIKAALELKRAELAANQCRSASNLAGRWARALGVSRMNVGKAAEYAKSTWRDDVVAKALAESTFVDGGVLVPENVSQEVIALLRPLSAVRALGAREIPLPNGNLTMPYVNTGTTPYAIAENQNVLPSGMTFGEMEMKARKIRALVAISNDLMKDSGPAADAFVQQDMVQALRALEDQYFIRGTGTGNQMRGIRYTAGTTFNVADAAGTVNGSTNDEIISALMYALMTVETNLQGNPIVRGGWIFATRTKYKLLALKDQNGNWLFKDEMESRGTVWGFPFRATPVMPSNLNTVGTFSSKESEILFADFDKILVGNQGGLTIDVVPYGSYHDGTAVVSGLSTDQTVIAGTLRSDIGDRYRGAASVVAQGVTWGAT